MREYKPYKHQMGVEGPSFYREQQERRRQEQEAKERQGRDQPKTQESQPKHQPSMWDAMFGPRPPAPPAPVTPPEQAFQRRGFGTVDPNEWFEVAAIWNYVAQVRALPQYKGQVFQVDILTPAAKDLNQAAAEVSQFFRMPASAFQGLSLDDAWKQVIGPFLESLEVGLNRVKPFAITGTLRFELDEEGKLVLAYQDR